MNRIVARRRKRGGSSIAGRGRDLQVRPDVQQDRNRHFPGAIRRHQCSSRVGYGNRS